MNLKRIVKLNKNVIRTKLWYLKYKHKKAPDTTGALRNHIIEKV